MLRAAAKYGYAVAHVASLYAHLRDHAPAGGFELEVSVDETATVTTHVEHVYIADALARLGVSWVSLAPRYVGRFEKGSTTSATSTRCATTSRATPRSPRAWGPTSSASTRAPTSSAPTRSPPR